MTAAPTPPANGPPSAWKAIPRIAWIGAIGVSLSMCLLGMCVGAGIVFMFTKADKGGAKSAISAKAAIGIVGKWETVSGGSRGAEFKADGTGTVWGTDLCKWHVTDEEKPVLVTETGPPPRRTYHHVTLDGDTLTLTPLKAEGQTLVFRRLKEATSKKKDAGGKFDPNDFDRTAKWALEVADKHEKLAGNKIAFVDSLVKFNDDCGQLAGKKFSWSIPVRAVSDKDVDLIVAGNTPVTRPGLALMRPEAIEKKSPFATWVTAASVPFGLIVGKEISRERAALLKPNSPVLVKGTVRQVLYQQPLVIVVIADLRGE